MTNGVKIKHDEDGRTQIVTPKTAAFLRDKGWSSLEEVQVASAPAPQVEPKVFADSIQQSDVMFSDAADDEEEEAEEAEQEATPEEVINTVEPPQGRQAKRAEAAAARQAAAKQRANAAQARANKK